MSDLVVKTIIIPRGPKAIPILRRRASLLSVWETEEIRAAGILHTLRKSLIPPDLDITDRSPRRLHGLFEMRLGEFGDGVFLQVFFHLVFFAGGLAFFGALDVDGDGLLDGELDGALGDEAEIGTGEAVRVFGDEVDVDVVGDRGLAELGFEDGGTALFVGQRDVDESVETTGTAEGVVELLGTIGGADDEDVLL